MSLRRLISFSSALRDLRPARAVPLVTAAGFDPSAIMRRAVAKARSLRRLSRLTWAQAMAVGLKTVWALARAEAARLVLRAA